MNRNKDLVITTSLRPVCDSQTSSLGTSLLIFAKGVVFKDGTTFERIDDDECAVQNNVEACTNALIHDTLICANGDGLSVCNVNAEVTSYTQNCVVHSSLE